MALETEIDRLVVRLIGEAESFHKMIRDAQLASKQAAGDLNKMEFTVRGLNNELKLFSKNLNTMSRDMARFGALASVTLTAPITLFGKNAVKAFAEFDQAMTETFAKMGRQSPEVRLQMENFAKDLATGGQYSYSPIQIAKGYEQLASAGLDAQASIAALPIALRFAQAGAMTTDMAIKQLFGSMESFGVHVQNLSTKQLEAEMIRFGDAITAVANDTTADVEQVARAMSQDAAVAAKKYGMTLNELSAVLAVYAQENKNSEKAGNLAGRAVRLLTNSFIQEKAAWDAMGINIVDKQTGQWIKFADAIREVEKAFAGLTGPERVEKMRLMGFKSLTEKSIDPLIGHSDTLKRFEESLGRPGTMSDMANIQMESFSNQMKIVKNHLEAMDIEIGQVMAPAIKFVGELLKEFSNWWRGLSADTQRYILIAGAVVAAMGPIVATLALVTYSISLVTSGFRGFIGFSIILGEAIAKSTMWLLSLRDAANKTHDGFTTLVDTGTKVKSMAASSPIINAAGNTTKTVAPPIFSEASKSMSSLASVTATQHILQDWDRAANGARVHAQAVIHDWDKAKKAVRFSDWDVSSRPLIREWDNVKSTASTVCDSLAMDWNRAGKSIVWNQSQSVSISKGLISSWDKLSQSGSIKKAWDAAGPSLYARAIERAKDGLAMAAEMASQFRVELSLLSAAIGYWVGTQLANAIYGLSRVNEEMQRGIELESKLRAARGESHLNRMDDVGRISDPDARLEATRKGLESAQKELDGNRKALESARKGLQEAYMRAAPFPLLGTGLEKWAVDLIGNKVVALSKTKVEEAKEAVNDGERFVKEWRQRLKSEGSSRPDVITKPDGPTVAFDPAIVKAKEEYDQLVSSLKQADATFGMTTAQARAFAYMMEFGKFTTAKQREELNALVQSLDDQEAAERLNKDVDDLTKSIERQIAALSREGNELAIYDLELRNSSDSQLEALNAANERYKAAVRDKKMTEDAARIIKDARSPMEEYLDTQKQLYELFDAGKLTVDQFNKAMHDAEIQMNKKYEAHFQFKGIEAAEYGSAEMMARLNEFRSLKPIPLPEFKRERALANVASEDIPSFDLRRGRAGMPNATVPEDIPSFDLRRGRAGMPNQPAESGRRIVRVEVPDMSLIGGGGRPRVQSESVEIRSPEDAARLDKVASLMEKLVGIAESFAKKDPIVVKTAGLK